MDDVDIDNKYDKVFTFAPGEGQHPLSLYQDKDAEYLCFPTIFCGQTPPSRDERLVPVHYSDIVKYGNCVVLTGELPSQFQMYSLNIKSYK